MLLKKLVGYVAMLADAGAVDVTIKFGPLLVSATFLPPENEEAELAAGIGFKVDGEPDFDDEDEGDDEPEDRSRIGF